MSSVVVELQMPKFKMGERLRTFQGDEVEVLEYWPPEKVGQKIYRIRKSDGETTFRSENALLALDAPPPCKHQLEVAIIPHSEAHNRGLVDAAGKLLCDCVPPPMGETAESVADAAALLSPDAAGPDGTTQLGLLLEKADNDAREIFNAAVEELEAAPPLVLNDGLHLFAVHAPSLVETARGITTGEPQPYDGVEEEEMIPVEPYLTSTQTFFVGDAEDYQQAKALSNPACTQCKLHGGAKNVCVPGEGPTEATVFIVGQNPGHDEDRQNRPFVGPTGGILNQLLAAAGFDRADLYVSNAVKCITPGDRKPNKKETTACNNYLVAEVANYRPEVIVLLGNTALEAVTGQTKITSARGARTPMSEAFRNGLTAAGVPLEYDPFILPTMHPSGTIHSPKADLVRSQIIGDLKTARNEITGAFVEIPTPWRWVTESADILKQTVMALPDLAQQVWAFDLETNGMPLWHPNFRIGMLGVDTGHDPIGVFRGRDVLNGLEMLRFGKEHGITLLGHNATGYDRPAFEERTGVSLEVDDTMLLEHLLNEDGTKNLQDIAVRRLGVRPWKDDLPENVWARLEHGQFNDEEWERLALYNARDTRYARLVFLNQMEGMAQDPALYRYYKNFFLARAKAASRIERNGIFIPMEKIQTAWGHYEIQKVRADTAAQLLTGVIDFNPNSAQQVRKLIFDKMGLPGQEWTDGGDESTNEFSLKKLKYLVETDTLFAHRPEVPALVNAILESRQATKYRGTYLEPYARMALQSPHAQRVFPRYSLTNAVSRSASFEPNTQNRPRDLDIVGAPPGFVLIHADASQLEMRTIAQVSGSPQMIQALNEGKDLHRELAIEFQRIKGLPNPEEVSAETRNRVKPANFGFGYGADEYTVEVIALKDHDIVMPRSESTPLRDAFHSRWQLRPWYERQYAEARETGMVRSPSGRIRHLPAIRSSNDKERLEALRQAINFPAQELGFTMWGCVLILATAMAIKVVQEIHDSLDAEVPECPVCAKHQETGGSMFFVFDHECELLETYKKIKSIEATIPLVLKQTFGIDLLVPFIIDVSVHR